MQDIKDDHFIRPIHKDQKMRLCPREPQVCSIIDQNRTASAMPASPG
ncbi:hypothetical protein [Roseovarius sp. MMSF_3281]|nr:hypothetical protein [Roseovarius sp. MMSF_3281]